VHRRDRRRVLELFELAPETSHVRIKRVRADECAVRPAGTNEIAPPDRFARPGEEPGQKSDSVGVSGICRAPSATACTTGSRRSPATSSAPSPPLRRSTAWSRATSSTKANGFVR